MPLTALSPNHHKITGIEAKKPSGGIDALGNDLSNDSSKNNSNYGPRASSNKLYHNISLINHIPTSGISPRLASKRITIPTYQVQAIITTELLLFQLP